MENIVFFYQNSTSFRLFCLKHLSVTDEMFPVLILKEIQIFNTTDFHVDLLVNYTLHICWIDKIFQ